MKKNSGLALVLAIALASSGCALFLLGAGGLGGYAISKDEVEGFVSKDPNKVWNEARKVIEQQGYVRATHKEIGRLEGEVDGSAVKIDVEQVSPDTTRLRVQARKGITNVLPNLELAQKLFADISKKL